MTSMFQKIVRPLTKTVAVLSLVSAMFAGSVSHVDAQSYYSVQKGDTLYSIARAYGLTVMELMLLNDLVSSQIDVGDLLLVSIPADTGSVNHNGVNVHVVQRGDTLYSIARAYGTTVENLMSYNNLTSTRIDIGDQIALFGASSQPAPQNPAPAPASDTYTVQAGDSLSKIALYYGVTVDQLMAWNQMSSTLLYPGDRLAIQAGAQPTWSQPTPSYQSSPAVDPSPSSSYAYTVQPGDNVYDLGLAFGMTEGQVLAYNGMRYDLIYPGDILYFPNNPVAVIGNASANSNSTSTSSNPQTSSSNSSNTSNPSVNESTTTTSEKTKEESSSLKTNRTTRTNLRKPESDKNIKLADPTTPAEDGSKIEVKTHEVQEGEKLEDIAKQYNVSTSDLKQWNKLLNDEIAPGKILYTSDPKDTVTVFKGVRPLKSVYPLKYKLDKSEDIAEVLKKFKWDEQNIRKWSELAEDQKIELGQEITVTSPDHLPKIHTVAEGESIQSVADANGVPVEAIRAWNGLQDNIIYVGEELAVSNPWLKFHEVQPGEKIDDIAAKYDITPEMLRAWNEIPAQTVVVRGELIVSDPLEYEEDQEDSSSEDQQTTVDETSQAESN